MRIIYRLTGLKVKPGDTIVNRMGQEGRLIDVRTYPLGPSVEVDFMGTTVVGDLDDWGLVIVK